MADHTHSIILCAYCDREATKQVMMDIGTRYVCDEHHKLYSFYWPVKQLDQFAKVMLCGVKLDDDDMQEKEPFKVIPYDVDEDKKKGFFWPVVFHADTAEYVYRLVKRNLGDEMEEKFAEKLDKVLGDLKHAYEHCDGLDRINNSGKYAGEHS